ncbi:MAG: nucleotidyltransferase [Bacteroidota bacterium]
MAYTVGGAFTAFRSHTVDLDSDQTRTARTSRDYLIKQVRTLAGNDSAFPRLGGDPIHYGSFARRTKIRPLDDIDLMVVLDGTGTTEHHKGDGKCWLQISDQNAPLAAYPDSYGYVSSIKVLNRMRDELGKLSSYRKAEVRRNQQAVVLNLVSYDWSFDLVPAVPIANFLGTVTHYLIPNGSGDWMRTDPRKDQAWVTRINQRHSNRFLPLVRLLKHWNVNGAQTKPRLPSYYFEALAARVFDGAPLIQSLPDGVAQFFSTVGVYVSQSCPDPKGLGPALDADISWDTKQKVIAALGEASERSGYARMYERQSNHEKAIYWWGRVFGSSFPTYG